jgi:two-component system response regulator
MKMNGKTILLVEDNPDDEALAIRALKKNNIVNEVVLARDGAEALNYLLGIRSLRDMPAVILLDLKLPKLSGFEVLEQIRKNSRTKLLPVVVLTSSREEDDRMHSYRLGANSYVRKSVDYLEFADAVRQLGLYWLLINDPPPPKEVL